MRLTRAVSRWFLVAAIFSATAVVLSARDGAAVEGIDHYLRVTDTVSIGGQPTPAQILALREAGFHAILNLREDAEYDEKEEAAAAREAGLTYLRIPVRSSDPHDAQADEFLRVTDDAANLPIFIHCAAGNRAGAFWLIRRVLRDGKPFEEAEAEARRIGLKSPNLVEFARAYVEKHPAAKR